MLVIGDHVVLSRGQKGILRWKGRVIGRGSTEFAGVELIGPDASLHGKHSGEFNGRKYFSTSVPGTGLFVSPAKLSTIAEAPPKKTAMKVVTPARQHVRKPGLERLDTSARSSIAPKTFATHTTAREVLPEVSGPLVSDPWPEKATTKTAGAARAHLETMIASQRAEYRKALDQIDEQVEDLNRHYASKLQENDLKWEAKLKSERRSSLSNSNLGLEELAKFQNKMVADMAERDKQLDALRTENASLRRELALSRRDDSEAHQQEIHSLLQDLEAQEERLRSMQSNLNENAELKREIERLRVRNGELELMAEASSSSSVASSFVASPYRGSAQETLQSSPVPRAHRPRSLHPVQPDYLLSSTHASTVVEPLQIQEPLRMAPEKIGTYEQLASTLNSEENHGDSQSDTELRNETGKYTLDGDVQELDALKKASESGRDDSYEREKAIEAEAMRHLGIEDDIEALKAPKDSHQFDLAAGRSNWCALCEQEGHTAAECMFD